MWLIWVLAVIVLVFGFVVFRGAPYVPSHRRQVERAFDELRVLDATDTVIDAGSGDGIILRVASKRGAKAVGYELNPILVGISRFLSRGNPNVHVYFGDFWRATFPRETTLVYGFMVERDMEKMVKKLQEEADRLGKPFDFITYGATIPGRKKIGRVAAHHLYRFEPLQQRKP